MALQKETISKQGVTGNYIAVHAISYDNEKKSAAYSAALYFSAGAKNNGAEPLQIIYQGKIEHSTPENLIAQCYEDMKGKAAAVRTVTIPAKEGEESTEIEVPAYPLELQLFGGAVDI